MAFAHLHVHTEYSLLDGSCKIRELAARAKELGFTSLAMTDHGVMYGAVDFYRACKAEGIKPIIGCEVYVAPGSRFDREPGAGDERYYHLILLAENRTGYYNLLKIVSRGFTEGYYYRPRVDKSVLREFHEGLIACSACLAGEVARLLTRGDYEGARAAALSYADIFGKDSFFLELQDHGISEQQTVNTGLLRLSRETGLKLIATNDVHYINAEDAEAHDILLCIQTGKKVSDEDRLRYPGGQYYLKSEEEMRRLFPYAQDALDNTAKVAERCQVEIEFGMPALPKFHVPGGRDAYEYLLELCTKGLAERYPEGADLPAPREKLQERLDYELSVIHSMGYVDYFLIVQDFIRYARSQGILVGPGRGSGAGSLVAYTLQITNVDPIRNDLIFERFLNPERVSMPDIDVDFCDDRRQEVIDYVVRTYGEKEVVQIVTFGTLLARAVIRDVGRVLDLPYALCDQVAKQIPRERDMTIAKALQVNRELSDAYAADERVQKLLDFSMRLEGLPRHTSIHAAGVVICAKPVEEFVPLSRGADGTITTQYTMTTLEELGLLKMDFLGLRTLTVIREAAELVKQNRGIDVNPEKVNLEDPAVMADLATGRNDGVFQLESAGMKNFMKELKPRSLEDVTAGISLYRPGPMDFIPRYLEGKNHPESITYETEKLKPILSATYGCIIYQEQVMRIVQELAGYTLGRSDEVRRAMSKKKLAVMERERQTFIYGNAEEHVPGCIANGIPEAVAAHIYDEMIDFANYAFNKSHAAAYAVVSMETAWLKHYYPAEFMAALLTSFLDYTDKVSDYIQVCRQMGIRVLPPDVNRGGRTFTVDGEDIVYGLSAIKSVGGAVIDGMVEERNRRGPYKDLYDFLSRTASLGLNRRAVECLILAGALDCLPGNRRQKVLAVEGMLAQIMSERKSNVTGQIGLFDLMEEKGLAPVRQMLPKVEDYSRKERYAFEKEMLGLYVSGHPLEEDEALIRANVTAFARDFAVSDEEDAPAGIADKAPVTVAGIVAGITVKTTKNGRMMAFVNLEDRTGTVECIFFPQAFEQYRSLLTEDEKLVILGRAQAGDEENGRVVADLAVRFSDTPKEVWVRFADRAAYAREEAVLYGLLAPYKGPQAVVVYLAAEKAYKRLPAAYGVLWQPGLADALTARYGRENWSIVEKKIEKPAGTGYNRTVRGSGSRR